jgi:hypothetical protein
VTDGLSGSSGASFSSIRLGITTGTSRVLKTGDAYLGTPIYANYRRFIRGISSFAACALGGRYNRMPGVEVFDRLTEIRLS